MKKNAEGFSTAPFGNLRDKSTNCESLSRVYDFSRKLWRGNLRFNNVIFQ